MKTKLSLKNIIKDFWYWHKDYIFALIMFAVIVAFTLIVAELFGGDVQYDPNYQPEDELPGGIHV